MALLLKRLCQGYLWIFHDLPDPRPIELGLISSSTPILPISILSAYAYFCLALGPRLMQNRKPFDLKNVIIVYNIIQVIANALFFYQTVIEVLFYSNWSCQPIDYSYSPRAIFLVKLVYYFYLLKLSDFLDTIFFVLRKKNNQLSFLHIYHHSGMFVMLWLVLNFWAGGHGVWVGLINTFVHIIMYTYYTLAALDNSWCQNLAFKKFITQIQLVQFGAFILIYGRLLFIDCAYPKLPCFLFIPQNVFMFCLFADFYRKAYIKRK